MNNEWLTFKKGKKMQNSFNENKTLRREVNKESPKELIGLSIKVDKTIGDQSEVKKS